MPESEQSPAILLVSGSSQTAKLIDRLLSGQFKVHHAEDTSQAWDVLQNQTSISLLLCELGKAIDKTALLERIRQAQNEAIKGLPVLLLVGQADEDSLCDQAFSVGATDFINMPFTTPELKARVRLHAGLYENNREASVVEISEQKFSVDSLNTLMQEEYFKSRLDQEVAFSARHKSYVSVGLMKIDTADVILDKYGRKILTSIIQKISSLIEQMMRREDTYAYLGDATYAFLYPVTNGLGTTVATRRLMDKVANKQFKLEGQEVTVSLSAGLLSEMPSDKQTAEEIMKKTRGRLQNALELGRGQVVSGQSSDEQSSISIEQALNMIDFGRTQELEKQIPQLLDKVLPLLEFARQHNGIDLE